MKKSVTLNVIHDCEIESDIDNDLAFDLDRDCDSSNNIFKASALWADAFYKSKCPYVCLFVCVSVCVFTFEVPFNGLFAPTSRSQMSNIFGDSESLGKSNGKKWSHI